MWYYSVWYIMALYRQVPEWPNGLLSVRRYIAIYFSSYATYFLHIMQRGLTA